MSLGWLKIEPNPSSQSAAGERSPDGELSTSERFRLETPRRRFEDLVLSPPVREQLESAMSQILNHALLYDTWNLRQVDPERTGIALNLFGPPGTGKSFCAEAIATRLQQRLLRVNYAEIESKYVGETPKNITAAFDRAREAGAVLFFDESDSILGQRLTHVTQSADHGVNVSRSVMLTQLDRFAGVVIFATNLARNYDAAFVRRILAHIEFELPDASCRRELWRRLIPRELPVAGLDFAALVEESAGLSGGDMLNVVIAAASRAAPRRGEEQRVGMEDFRAAIRAVRNAKAKVGASSDPAGAGPLTIERQTLDEAELPADVRQRMGELKPEADVLGAAAGGPL